MAVTFVDRPFSVPTELIRVSGLICFWDFQEPAGSERCGHGPYPLYEANGPIERVEGGIVGRYAARIRPGQYFTVPRAECPALDIYGDDAEVSVVAWVKRESLDFWQYIAGVWDETRSQRQYGLFLNARAQTDSRTMQRVPCENRVHGHISAVGGPTPGDRVCRTYASGATEVPTGIWQCVGMTYDGSAIGVYVNGALDESRAFNPFPYADGIFEAGEGGADFTVGANSVRGVMENYFGGLIGGLAVYDRSLTVEEMQALGASTR